LAFLIISGVYIGYIGYTSYDDRRGGISQTQDVTGPSDELADALSASIMYSNQHGTDAVDEIEHTATVFAEGSGYDIDHIEADTENMEVYDGKRVYQEDPSKNFSENVDEEYVVGDDLEISDVEDHSQFAIRITPDLIEDDVIEMEITTADGSQDFEIWFDRAGNTQFGNVELERDGDVHQVPIGDSSEPIEIDLLRGNADGKIMYENPINEPVEGVKITNAQNTKGGFSSTYYDSNIGDSNAVYAAEISVTTINDGHAMTRELYVAPGTASREVVAE